MTTRFDRLLALARKTGHPLIIHDRASEQDLVVMDVNDYEMLFDCGEYDELDEFSESIDSEGAGEEWQEQFFEEQVEKFSNDGVAGLSEAQMLDKINRDIALWKAAQEPEENTTRATAMAEEASLSSASSQKDLQDQQDLQGKSQTSLSSSLNSPFSHAGEILKQMRSKFPEVQTDTEAVPDIAIRYETYEPAQASSPVPYAVSAPPQTVSQSEPLADEPIFFEEPTG